MNQRMDFGHLVRGLVAPAIIALGLVSCEETVAPLAPEDVTAAAGSTGRIDAGLAALLGGGAAPVEVIVTFDPGTASSDGLTQAVQGLGAGVITFRHLPMIAALATPDQVTQIAALPGVRSVYENRRLDYHLRESVHAMGADAVWTDLGYTGRGVGVAILDSGIDGLYNSDVAYPGRTVQNVKFMANADDIYSTNGIPFVGFDLFVEGVPNTDTSMGHGTHVAGIAAGNGDRSRDGVYTGVAPEANLIGISAGETLVILWALAGFDYVLENHQRYNIKVVNNSWGSSGMFDPDDPINVATKLVADAGVTVVFSAGNCGTGDPLGVDCPLPGENQVNPYSAAPWVISVAAACKPGENWISQCNDGRANRLADFSSRGLPGDPLHHPDILAPGVYIVSARASTGTIMNGLDANRDTGVCEIAPEHVLYYTCASGTSMSSPHIAGLVALMQEAAGRSLPPSKVIEILQRTADRMPGYAIHEVGAGAANAVAAVERAASR